MSQSILTARDTVTQAALNYMVDTGIKPVHETSGADGLVRTNTAKFVRQLVTIHDGRATRDAFTLDTSGFALVAHPTAMKDFYDHDELAQVYLPEMQRLIAKQTGAGRVHVFDHTLRSGDAATRQARKIREPVKLGADAFSFGARDNARTPAAQSQKSLHGRA